MESSSTEKRFRQERGDKVAKFLSRVKASEFFQKVRENPREIENIPFEKFQDFLIRLNGIARNKPTHERRADGENVYLKGVVENSKVPRHADKEDLLRFAYESVPNIKNHGDEAYMLPAAVNAVHQFADGNGRTSRIVSLLLTEFNSDNEFQDALKKALGEDGRFESLNIDASHINVDIERIVSEKHGMRFDKDGKAVMPEGFGGPFSLEKPQSEKAKEFLELSHDDVLYCFQSLYNYLQTNNLLNDVTIHTDYGDTLSVKEMDKILKPEDWGKVLADYYNLKKEHVEVLVNAFVDPENYKTSNGKETLRDYFIKSIKREYSSNQA